MSIKNTLKVTEIQRFCMHDGPGVRTTVFLKGCPLRCAWCHNPETQLAKSELSFANQKCIICGACMDACRSSAHSFENGHVIWRDKCVSCFACVEACPTGALAACGIDMRIEDILTVVDRDRAFYGKDGGVTLSGGEPLFQLNTVELLRAVKANGISTAVETCGYVSEDVLRAVIPYTDLFLWDVKDTDSERHQKYTGMSNEKVISNLKMADSLGAKIRLRCIVVNGVNTDIEHYERLAALAHSLENCEGIELIPYHAYGGSKAKLLGLEDNGKKEWIPPADEIFRAKEILKSRGANII